MTHSRSIEDQLPPLSPGTCESVQKNDSKTSAKYAKFTDMIRRFTSNDLQCSILCGGEKCKYDTGSVWSTNDKAIPIIFSHWVTDEILATARPNTLMIKEQNLIELFLKENIRTLINLQEPGEHSNCGPCFEKSTGFSYDPKVFMDNNNFSDLSLDALMDMVKVLTFSLLQGKVAVHCHAGLGRTGTLIAAYLIFTYRCPAQSAVNFVRSRRPRSIQTASQLLILFKFANHISKCFIVFNQVSSTPVRATLHEFLKRQNYILHGKELRILRHLPKIVFIICEKLANVSNSGQNDSDSKNKLDNFRKNYLSFKNLSQIKDLTNLDVQRPTLDGELETKVDEKLIESLMEDRKDKKLDKSKESIRLEAEIIKSKSSSEHRSSFIFSNDSIVSNRLKVSKQFIIQTLIQQPNNERQFINEVYNYQKEINNRPSGWNNLRNETNVEMLCALLLIWFENLDEPILDDKIIQKIKPNFNSPNFIDCFYHLDIDTKFLLEYLSRFIIELCDDQTSDDLKKLLLIRIVSCLTKKKIETERYGFIPRLPRPTWPVLYGEDKDTVINFFNELTNVIKANEK